MLSFWIMAAVGLFCFFVVEAGVGSCSAGFGVSATAAVAGALFDGVGGRGDPWEGLVLGFGCAALLPLCALLFGGGVLLVAFCGNGTRDA